MGKKKSSPKEQPVEQKNDLKQMIMVSTIVILLAHGITWTAGYFFQDDFLYQTSDHIKADPGDIWYEFDDLYIETPDGETLNAWWIPQENYTEKLTIFYCHGNSLNIGNYLTPSKILFEQGYNVFIFDYRGYGRSTGETDEEGTYIDVKTCYSYMLENYNLTPNQTVVYGRSMGGPIAAYLMNFYTPAALVLESTFTTCDKEAEYIAPWIPWNLFDTIEYPTIDYLQKAKCPVLIIHSKGDLKIRYHNGEELFKAAPEPKEMLTITGGHGDGYKTSGKVYTDGLNGFIERNCQK